MAASMNPVSRPVASFKPSPWTARFLDYTLDVKVDKALRESAKSLKEEVRMEITCIGNKPIKDQLCFIDLIEKLGVAYHFEKEIDDSLQHIHKISDSSTDNLFHTSLRFRLFRQHGLTISSDVFKGFINWDESLKEVDMESVLSLYEACHVRGHEDAILDEALTISMSKLNSMKDELRQPLKEEVSHALLKPLQKWPICLSSIHHIHVYEKYPLHNKTLLRFAKVHFNLLQSTYRKELSDLCRWWKGIAGVTTELPLRDRIVECYLVSTMIFYEPHHSFTRKIFTIGIHCITTIDDFYDAYGLPEELEIFTEAIRRWDRSCIDQLPGELGKMCALVLNIVDEIEKDSVVIGRSEYIKHVKEEMILQCEAYHIEAKWRNRKYVPTLDEYMGMVHRDSGHLSTAILVFFCMDMATHEDFEWISNLSKPIKATCLHIRIMNDIGSEWDKERDLSPLGVECHMKHYDVSYKQACKELYGELEGFWKDMNEAMIPPMEVPFPLLKCIRNMFQSVEVFYYGGRDGLTRISTILTEGIQSLFLDPMPINED